MSRTALAINFIELPLARGTTSLADKFSPGVPHFFESFDRKVQSRKSGPHLNIEQMLNVAIYRAACSFRRSIFFQIFNPQTLLEYNTRELCLTHSITRLKYSRIMLDTLCQQEQNSLVRHFVAGQVREAY